MSWKKKRLNTDVDEQEIFKASGSISQQSTNSDNVPEDMPMEPMAFLQGLNSGNLMQFSQQSVLRDMMLQDIKAQINSLPKLENHNNGDYNFNMIIEQPPKSHWMFSKPLNKLYIRMNKTFNIDVKFKTKLPIQPLNLRTFLCFVKDVSGPVLRCQNHLSTDPIKDNKSMRESLLRCDNPNISYCGSSHGKSIADRYSVLVPLNMSIENQSGGFVRQTLAFSFSCQNSCFGRKETCLVFCLENINGDILGQQVLYLKICTCPKRDRKQDERHLQMNKMEEINDVAEEGVGTLHDKKGTQLLDLSEVKDENDSNESLDLKSIPNDWEVSQSMDGVYRLVVNCSSKDLLLQNIEGMIEKTAVAILRRPQNTKLRQHAYHLLNLKRYGENLP